MQEWNDHGARRSDHPPRPLPRNRAQPKTAFKEETMPTIVHFEIPADDMDRAASFYKELFGWTITPWNGSSEYWMIATGAKPSSPAPEGTAPATPAPPALEGGMMKRRSPDQSIIHYVDVASLDDALKQVVALGGTVTVPKMPVPNMGYFAVCRDTEANAFGLWQTDPKAGFFRDAAEVLVAVALAVIAADGRYSVDEMRFVWYDVEQLDIFQGREYKAIESWVLSVFEKKTAALTPFSPEQVDLIVTSARQLLSPALLDKAFETALKVAYADKTLDGYTVDMDFREKPLIERFRTEFGISETRAEAIAKGLKPAI